MKPILFPYRKEKSPSGTIYRPVAKIKLFGPNTIQLEQSFYIDSGADCSLIPFGVGEILGLKTKGRAQRIGGIGGFIEIFHSRVKMSIGNFQFYCLLAWAQTERVPCLLGREDVFDHFNVLFNQKQKRVAFYPLGKFMNP